MSTKRVTRPMLERTLHLIDSSGLIDIIAPPPPPNRPGRRGRIRENTRLWAIGVVLCTRLGHETTITGVHQVLTVALPRETQWELGVLRPLTTKHRKTALAYDPERSALTNNGKPIKEVWIEDGIERLGYDDLTNAVEKLTKGLAYGNSALAGVSPEERTTRQRTVEDAVDCLIAISVIERLGNTVAIDGTGQWAWSIGSSGGRVAVEKKGPNQPKDDPDFGDGDKSVLELADIVVDDGNTTPDALEIARLPAPSGKKCVDAAWGYKTSKGGTQEVAFGFHQHTIVRTPDPNQAKDSEPLLVEGLVVVPANQDVVEASLRLIDRARRRSPIKRVIGDLLYTNLKASRWAVELADRGIEQVLAMRVDNSGLMDINGAVMQYGWMHCPAAPMDQRPMPATFAKDDTAEHFDAVEEFKKSWAFDRKESGLGTNRSTKWICPAMANKVGCNARGPASVETAKQYGLPIVTAPDDYASRKCCTNKTMDFTPDPSQPAHQRKLMQREYYGDRRWRHAFNLRSFVEGAFGILKNPSRQRMTRGQNRVPGLVMVNLLNALKVAVYNEEQLRSWHERTGKGPADHALLQPDGPDWGITELTKGQSKALDAMHLAKLNEDTAATLAA